MIKVIVQEETEMDEGPHTYMQTKYEITSHSKKVVAEALRAIADEYDPKTEVPHRRGLPTVYKGE